MAKTESMKGSWARHPFLWRSILFAVLFITVAGIIGARIIGTELLFEYGFYLYANLGKMVVFSLILFALLTRGTIQTLPVTPFRKKQLLPLIFAWAILPVFFLLADQLQFTTESPAENVPLFLTTHVSLILIPAYLALGVYGETTLRSLIGSYKKQLVLCVGITLLYAAAIFQVWKLWPYFSGAVLYVVRFLFSQLYDIVVVLPPYGLLVQNFAVLIEESCSGLDSLFLFSTLYIILVVLDWNKLHPARAAFLFIPALIGLFAVNILRVFSLIWIGVEISPQLSQQLFHTYLGMVLFIVYFMILMKIGYPWLLKKNEL